MEITRRNFLKTSAVAGGVLATSGLLNGELETLVSVPEGKAAAAVTEKWVPTTCWIGKQDCGMLARVVNTLTHRSLRNVVPGIPWYDERSWYIPRDRRGEGGRPRP